MALISTTTLMILCLLVSASSANMGGVVDCQAEFANAISVATTPEMACRAQHGLGRCISSLDDIDDAARRTAQAFIDASQFVADCSGYGEAGLNNEPEFVVDDANLDLEMPINTDAVVRQLRRRTDDMTTAIKSVSIWNLRDRVDRLSQEFNEHVTLDQFQQITDPIMVRFQQQLEAANRRVEESLKVAIQGLTAVVTNTDAAGERRVDRLVFDIYNTTQELNERANISLVPLREAVDAYVVQMQASAADLAAQIDAHHDAQTEALDIIGRRASEILQEGGRLLTTTVQAANSAKLNAGNEFKALENTLTGMISATAPYTKGDVFTHWGQTTCPDSQLLYRGVTYGAHHGHNGAAGTVCVPEGPNGGTETGTSSLDLLYPLSLDYTHGTSLIAYRTIRCARCFATKRNCFRMEGRPTCPSGFVRMYEGYLAGSHYTHAARSGRICINSSMDTSLGNSGHYIYSSRIQDTAPTIAAGPSIRCAICCRN
eukprot:m.181663 g.181663  ORF g.181663 m.181663 type:complete len:487 (-) comp16632_c1_seq1:338-1798(-)